VHDTEVVAVAADVAMAGTPQRLVATVVDRFGALDILVNRSGPPGGTSRYLTGLTVAIDGGALRSLF
jgi:NAD(P)-dependent dehydrogenase (short-subunit alcohol dehydrogenase family)